MSHELDQSIGRPAMAYVGDTPWHTLGRRMRPDASLEEWEEDAGMRWTARECPLYCVQKDVMVNVNRTVDIADLTHIDFKKALVRSDTGAPLSVVGSDYKVVQPKTVLEFYRDLIRDNGLKMETAGCLYGGRRVWALARMDDQFTLFGRDKTEPFVLMVTSYDGSFATQAAFTSTRVVCKNTLELAGLEIDSDEGKRFRVPHSTEFNAQHAHGKLGLSFAAWAAYKAVADELAHRIVSKAEAIEYFNIVAGKGKEIKRNPDNGKAIAFPEPGRVVTNLIDAFNNGPGADLPSARNTAWGLLQAATYCVDHKMQSKDEQTRLASATFGGGRTQKIRALAQVQTLLAA